MYRKKNPPKPVQNEKEKQGEKEQAEISKNPERQPSNSIVDKDLDGGEELLVQR